jgi:hypothetical protein
VRGCGEFDSKPNESDPVFLDFSFQKPPYKTIFFHPLTSILEVHHEKTPQNVPTLLLTGYYSVRSSLYLSFKQTFNHCSQFFMYKGVNAMKRTFLIGAMVLGFILSSSFVFGDFYVIPVKGQFISWYKILPASQRFKLVMEGDAVLDKETGLVWEQSPDTTQRTWTNACIHCYQREVANRKGWRLPTTEELASLVDNDNSNPTLPTGHPFSNVQSSYYWSATTSTSDASFARFVHFGLGHLGSEHKSISCYVWCVRGGHGHDAY